MNVAVEVIKTLYRALVPTSVRSFPVVNRLKAQLLPHDWTYDSDYYEKDVEGPAARSAGSIANSIVNDLKATCIIDVGCGTGALLDALRARGCDVFGLEYAEAAF